MVIGGFELLLRRGRGGMVDGEVHRAPQRMGSEAGKGLFQNS